MKYIDADKLLSEIQRLHKAHSGRYGCDEAGLILEYLEDFIESLQLEQSEVPTTKGWVARDREGRLGLYDQKPEYSMIRGAWEIGESWVGRFSLDKINAFPKLTQFHEPVEVELTIRQL